MDQFERLDEFIQHVIQINGIDYVALHYLDLRNQFYQSKGMT